MVLAACNRVWGLQSYQGLAGRQARCRFACWLVWQVVGMLFLRLSKCHTSVTLASGERVPVSWLHEQAMMYRVWVCSCTTAEGAWDIGAAQRSIGGGLASSLPQTLQWMSADTLPARGTFRGSACSS